MGKGGDASVTLHYTKANSSDKHAHINLDGVPLAPDEHWLSQLDLLQFAHDIRALGKELESQQGRADMTHLHKMVAWSNTCAFVGILTMGYRVNVVAIVALSTWTLTRWTMIAHHTCHGGYDKVDVSKRWNRFRFAVGSLWRRCCDWLDWMMPEAWNVEHNNRHHYNLSEITDPDLVENNLSDLRNMNVPLPVKYGMVLGVMATWKWFYYAPNTYKELKLAQWRKQGRKVPDGVQAEDAVTLRSLIFGDGSPFYSLAECLLVVLAPYFVIRFLLLPAPLLLLGYYTNAGSVYFQNAVINLVIAEALTNIHGFVVVVTNHAGYDMYRFEEPCRPFSGSFYLRQALASTNFSLGDDLTDFLHGWLNYQIEHHMWPNLSMLSYQKAAPKVKAICAKHGVPYIQENVFIRLKKTVDIMVGATSMKRFPTAYEQKFLEQDAVAEKAKSGE